MAVKSSNNITKIVVLYGVSKKFYNLLALDNVSFEINEGEIFGYIGPNGAGKTTTMKILVGLLNDFQGEVFVKGYRVPKQKDEVHKLLGYLPQNVAFQEWRTVNHALKTFGRLSGVSKAEIENRISKILDLLSISEIRYKKISQLSGGTTRKVGLAQALLHDPELLILDEPLEGLDPLSRSQFKQIILNLKKRGTTILFSSHILSDVQDVADRIGIISKGQINHIGTLNELKSNFSMQKTVEILLSIDNKKWKKIRFLKFVKEVEQTSPNRVLVRIEPEADEDQILNDIVQNIVKLDIRIKGIKLLSPSLDEIYLNYIQRGVNS